MPQVAHDAVALGMAAGSEVLVWTKAAPGLAPVAGALERPARALLGSKLGKTALLASDRVVSVADGAIDTAMGTGLFKMTARTVKTTYSSRVQPAAARMRSAYAAAARRSAAWRRQVTSEYHRILLRADGLVDAFLPPAAGGTDAVKLPSLLIKKKGVAGPAAHTCSSSACHARVRCAVQCGLLLTGPAARMRASRRNRAGRQSRPAQQEPRSAHGQGGQGTRACVCQDGVDGDARPPREHQQPGAGASRRGWTRDDGALQCAAGPRRRGGGHVAARTRVCFLQVARSRWCLLVRVLLVPTSCVCLRLRLRLCLCLSVCVPACLPAGLPVSSQTKAPMHASQ